MQWIEVIDEAKFLNEMLEHSAQENVLPPNPEEYFKGVFIDMRQAFRYVFGEYEFVKCVPEKAHQNLVYSKYPK